MDQDNYLPIFGRVLSTQAAATVGTLPLEPTGDALEAQIRFGGVVFNDRGQVLLREMKHHFDGYAWTFAKGKPALAEPPGMAAVRATAEKTGVVGGIVEELVGEFSGTSTGSVSRYYLMLDTGNRQPVAAADQTESVAWVRTVEAETLIRKTTNKEGQARDLSVLKAAVGALTFRLSIDSALEDGTADRVGDIDPHWMDWFRLNEPFGMPDGSPVTRAKLEAMATENARAMKVEAEPLGRVIRPDSFLPPTRNLE